MTGQLREGVPPRVAQLRDILKKNAPALAERFADVLDGADILRRTALLWRFEVETCVELVRRSAHGMVMTYEELAGDAYSYARILFRHFGIAFGEQTEQYIDRLYQLQGGSLGATRRTGWGGKYFSVYRNPREQKDSWMKRMPVEDRLKVEAIVQGAPGIDECAVRGKWW
jgi:hypothetical protein